MALETIANSAMEGTAKTAENGPGKFEVSETRDPMKQDVENGPGKFETSETIQDAKGPDLKGPDLFDTEDIRGTCKHAPGGIETLHAINQDLEGEKHPNTYVSFKRDMVELPDGRKVEGVFAEFDPICEMMLDKNENGNYEGYRVAQEKDCNQKLKNAVESDPELRNKFTDEQLEQIKNGDTPDGYTWHHHQQPGKMQLVDSEKHMKTGHTGGYSIWGSGSQEG
jgi:small nuclear ribonucleoprotein (snRNP)-like protein